MSRLKGVFLMLKSVVAVEYYTETETDRQPGQRGPVLRMVLAGVERLGQLLDVALQVVLGGADHRVADDRAELGVEVPMNEQAEALVAKPFEAVGAIGERGCGCGRCGRIRGGGEDAEDEK